MLTTIKVLLSDDSWFECSAVVRRGWALHRHIGGRFRRDQVSGVWRWWPFKRDGWAVTSVASGRAALQGKPLACASWWFDRLVCEAPDFRGDAEVHNPGEFPAGLHAELMAERYHSDED